MDDQQEWWRTAVVYQIYPRSFADSNDDGIGDLRGVLSRVDYLVELGVDAVWLTPFYPSPWADGGYDITDHRDVDARLGTLADFEELVSALHGRGIKLIVDIVPNHTSEQHPWFQEALAAPPGSPARDRYVFRTGCDGGPPSDWRSHFGGSAWRPLPDGDWYLHLFAAEQPDLNWQHPEVGDLFLDTLRFWADRGVDGFRVDVAHALFKDLAPPLRSQPNLDARLPLDGSDPLYDRDELHALYRTWRAIFDSYDPPRMGIAETWMPTTERTYLYARPSELGQVFDFSLLKSGWSRDRFRSVIKRSLADQTAAGGGPTWVLSSHDVPRHSSRLALPPDVDPDHWLISNGTRPPVDPARARRRARAATLMMLALPGSAYLYQGEELGLLEVADLPVTSITDPVFERTGRAVKGRDGCRVPLPWTCTGPSFGFGGGQAWLSQPDEFGQASVEAQRCRPGSTFELYREALGLRRKLQADDTALEWLPTGDDEVLHFRRSNGWECVVNFADTSRPAPDRTPLLCSDEPSRPGELAAESAVWLALRAREC